MVFHVREREREREREQRKKEDLVTGENEHYKKEGWMKQSVDKTQTEKASIKKANSKQQYSPKLQVLPRAHLGYSWRQEKEDCK